MPGAIDVTIKGEASRSFNMGSSSIEELCWPDLRGGEWHRLKNSRDSFSGHYVKLAFRSGMADKGWPWMVPARNKIFSSNSAWEEMHDRHVWFAGNIRPVWQETRWNDRLQEMLFIGSMFCHLTIDRKSKLYWIDELWQAAEPFSSLVTRSFNYHVNDSQRSSKIRVENPVRDIYCTLSHGSRRWSGNDNTRRNWSGLTNYHSAADQAGEMAIVLSGSPFFPIFGISYNVSRVNDSWQWNLT